MYFEHGPRSDKDFVECGRILRPIGCILVMMSFYFVTDTSSDTPKIQEGHAVLGHILCGLVEMALFKRPV